MSPRFERRPDKRTGAGGRGPARAGRSGASAGAGGYGRDRGARDGARREGGRDAGREGFREGGRDAAREGGRSFGGARSGPREGGYGAGGSGARPAGAPRPGGRSFGASRGAEGRGGEGRERSRFAPRREDGGRSAGRPAGRPAGRRFEGARGEGSRFEGSRFEGSRRPAPGGRFSRPLIVDADRLPPQAEAHAPADETQPSDLVWGRHAALAVLESGRPVHRIWCTAELRFSPRFLQLLREAKSSGVLVEEVTWARLGQLTGGAVHQGIVLQGAAADTLDLSSLIEGCAGVGEPPLLMALDGITDPHNLGAIARSAEALGAHGLVLPQRRSAGLTGSVAKVAAGALEHLPVARVVNLNRALDTLKQEGYRVVGLAAEGSVTLEEADLDGPLVIVTGSEGDGLSMLTRKHCDQLVRIPLRGATPSLNASVATALLLFEVARRGWMKGLRGGDPAPRIQRPQLAAPEPPAAAVVEAVVEAAADATTDAATEFSDDLVGLGFEADAAVAAAAPVLDDLIAEESAPEPQASATEPQVTAADRAASEPGAATEPAAATEPLAAAPEPAVSVGDAAPEAASDTAPVLELSLEPGASHGFLGDVQL